MNFEVPKSITIVRYDSATDMFESSLLPFASSPPPPSSLSLSLTVHDTPPQRPARRRSVGMDVDLGKIEIHRRQQQLQQQDPTKHEVRTDKSGDSDYGCVNKFPSPSSLSSPSRPPLPSHPFLSTQRSDSCIMHGYPSRSRFDSPVTPTRMTIIDRMGDGRDHSDNNNNNNNNNQIDPFDTTISTPRRSPYSCGSGGADGSNHSRWSSASMSPSSHLPPRMPQRRGGTRKGTDGAREEHQFVMRGRKSTGQNPARLVDEHAIDNLGRGQDQL